MARYGSITSGSDGYIPKCGGMGQRGFIQLTKKGQSHRTKDISLLIMEIRKKL